jgi:putative peptidoglycan lipid II flippase
VIPAPPPPRSAGGAALVASGILLSRVAGLVRLRVFAYFFGLQSDPADAFNAAFRIPNFLQNLFGEGALSASFIPVYASLVAAGDRRLADRVAGAVGALLALTVSAIVLAGVLGAPVLTTLLAPGFAGEKRALTVALVRILFPGAGLLVLSAWCLGVLNSHHRFLLSYAAPVVWNAAMIATMVAFGGAELPRLALYLAWGSVAGSALQVAVQLPAVLRVAPDVRFARAGGRAHVWEVVRNFLPAFVSRGVVQISAFVDALIASLLPTGAVTGLTNAQLIYTLPVSLFGMSVAASELPAMAGVDPTDRAALRERLDGGLRRIAFFVTPSAVAFLALGDVIAAALLQTGRFGPADAVYVWGILAGSSVGLLASTMGRLYASTFYAMRDPRTPLRYAIARVVLSTALGLVLAIPLPRWAGVDPMWGAAGITAAGGIAAWAEMLFLRRTLQRRLGVSSLDVRHLVTLWALALAAAAVAWAAKLSLPLAHPIVAGMLVLGSYGLSYLLLARFAGVEQASLLLESLGRRRR